MSVTLLHKRSGSYNWKPSAEQLVEGELAVNTNDGKLYTLVNGQVAVIGSVTFIEDAPSDGKKYLRQNNRWVEDSSGSSGYGRAFYSATGSSNLLTAQDADNIRFDVNVHTQGGFAYDPDSHGIRVPEAGFYRITLKMYNAGFEFSPLRMTLGVATEVDFLEEELTDWGFWEIHATE